MSDTRERMAEDLAVVLRQHGVTGWLKREPLPLARAIIASMLDITRCDFQEDSVRGDIGGPCRKMRGHDGPHDPFEKITPDSLREVFAMDAPQPPVTAHDWAAHASSSHDPIDWTSDCARCQQDGLPGYGQ